MNEEEFREIITNILWNILKDDNWKNTNEDMNKVFNLFKEEIKKHIKPQDVLRDLTVDIEKREIYANYCLDNKLDKLIITNILNYYD